MQLYFQFIHIASGSDAETISVDIRHVVGHSSELDQFQIANERSRARRLRSAEFFRVLRRPE